ncbi:MAG: hypothetical protein OXC48_00205 [Endozoicomonadaceae bacterium]|nr:hypothetical protein [Endozoicomonadaceae bacterium]
MDVLDWFFSFSLLSRIIIIAAIIGWIIVCYFLSDYTEKKWGDREVGVVLGFFVPMLLLMIWIGR